MLMLCYNACIMNENQNNPDNVIGIKEAPSYEVNHGIDALADMVQDSNDANPDLSPIQPEVNATTAASPNSLRFTTRARNLIGGLALSAVTAVGFNIAQGGEEHVEPAPTVLLQDYQQTGEVPDGYTAVKFTDVQTGDTASAESFKLTSGKDRLDLQGSIENQTDAQGDPGIQQGEVAVVKTEQVDQGAVKP